MSGYKPLYVRGMQTGLVEQRQEFILPDDAYPVLENMFVWREQIRRRQGLEFLARLRRVIASSVLDMTVAGQSSNDFNIFSAAGITETNAQIEPGSVQITITGGNGANAATYSDNGDGTFTTTGNGNASTSFIQYETGNVSVGYVVVAANPASNINVAFNYYPTLPVMGIRTRELNSVDVEQTFVFDTVYAYRKISGGYVEVPSTTPTVWNGTNSDFFWSTNYWVNSSNQKLFWVTNFSGVTGTPIRYYDNVTWTDFTPTINVAGDVLAQSLCILPFRGRLLVFNTLEGGNLASSVAYYQRIRWSAIGDPLVANAWRDDIRGKGGFLDIPTSENITSVGFVRDNLVVYCERSTWQLRYTGRSISPFQIEKVNSELGARSTFSAVQFDTSLVGIGDKGIVECDSYKSQRIDIKIPDLVFEMSNDNEAPQRIQGIRDIQQRLAYWTYVSDAVAKQAASEGSIGVYPNRRLVYNYENDSWANFTDSITAMGTYQPDNAISWVEAKWPWTQANYPWASRPGLFPAIIGGNQQGFVFYLGSNLSPKVSNQQTLTISSITGNTTTPTVIGSPSHNLVSGQVISISGIPTGTPFNNLNGGIFSVVIVNANSFQLWKYNATTGEFSTPQTDSPATYVGGGVISVRDNINIVSKKFNFLDEGKNAQMGYIDLLMNSTVSGSITMNVYINYNDNQPVNQKPENETYFNGASDPFFNTIIPTNQSQLGGITGTKYWQRCYCPVNGAFITLQFTLSNAQMAGVEQESEVQIDSQILWLRQSGRLQTF